MMSEKLGNITLYNADCMEVMKTFKDKQFDLAIVDPPYGIEQGKNSQPTRLNKYGAMSKANDLKPGKDYFDELFRVSDNQIIWGYNHLSDMLPPTKEFVFWYKHQPVDTYSDGELAWTSFKKTAKCFDFKYFGNVNADKERIHPTQKPVRLYWWLLDTYAMGGGKILDTHSGSLSIGIACHDLGHELTAIELDNEMYEKAKKRLCNHQLQLKLF